jgi:gliding motility-associated lipoprotein GldH
MKYKCIKYIIIVLLLISCSSSDSLITTYDFPDGQWQRFTNPLVQIEIKNPGIYYDMFVELKFDPAKQAEDFMMTVIMTSPGGEVRSRDIMSDFRSAVTEGKEAGFRVILRREYAFSEKGICTFEIENRSSKVMLPGMKSISIIFERSQES